MGDDRGSEISISTIATASTTATQKIGWSKNLITGRQKSNSLFPRSQTDHAFKSILAVVAPPKDDDYTIFLGTRYVFYGGLYDLVFIAFMFGYFDVYSIVFYETFSTTMTGNIIDLVISMTKGQLRHCTILILVIFGHTVIGCWLSAQILVWTNNRKKALFILMALQGLTVFIELGLNIHSGHIFQPYLIVLSIINGALFHWSAKSGFSTALQTINLQQIAETLFRYMKRFTQGGPRSRGDNAYKVLILFSFFVGALVGATVSFFTFKFALVIPLILSFFTAYFCGDPKTFFDFIHYLGRGCVRSTKFVGRNGEGRMVELSSTTSPLARDESQKTSVESMENGHTKEEEKDNGGGGGAGAGGGTGRGEGGGISTSEASGTNNEKEPKPEEEEEEEELELDFFRMSQMSMDPTGYV